MVNSLMTKKLQDFNDWCILVNIFYYGYNRISESIPIINKIRLSWNNFRLQDLTLPTTPPAREDFNNSIIQQIKPLKCKEQKEGELKTHGFMDNNELKKLLDIAGISRGIEFKIKLSYLFNIPSPYIIKDGIRFLRGSNSLVSEKRNIYCINVLTNNILKFSSLTDCGKALSINRSTIKNYLISGQIYKNYRFTFKA